MPTESERHVVRAVINLIRVLGRDAFWREEHGSGRRLKECRPFYFNKLTAKKLFPYASG